MRPRKPPCFGGGAVLPFFILFLFAASSPAWAQGGKTDSLKSVETKTSSASAPTNYTVDGFRNYTKVSGLSGILRCSGSRGFDKVLPAWSEAFQKLYPGVELKNTFVGSGAAIGAILKSEAEIGLMSRPITPPEIKQLTEGLGYKPSWIPVLVEAEAIVVNKKNPVPGLSLKQLDGIYSKSLKRGAASSFASWEEVGVWGDLGKQRIEAFSRPAKSTGYEFFVEGVLLNGEMRSDVRECTSAPEMLKQVAQNPAAIGSCGLDAVSDDVRALPVGTKDKVFFTPKESNIRSGAYPLVRQYVLIFNRKPGQDTDRLTYEFLRFVLSMEGHAIAVEKGFYSVSNEEMRMAYQTIE